MKVELKDPALFVFLSMSNLCHIPFHWFLYVVVFFLIKRKLFENNRERTPQCEALIKQCFFLDDSHHSNTSCCTVLFFSFSWSFIRIMIYVLSALVPVIASADIM